MPTISPQVTPYYGGGQVVNPANVQVASGAPSTVLTEALVGTIQVDPTNQNCYMLVAKSGGVSTWFLLGGNSAGLNGLAADTGSATPSGNSITLAGTASEITTAGSGSTITFSIPSTFVAPGSIASTTGLTAGTTFSATGGASTFVGTFHANVTGAATSVIGTGGTGAVQIGNATGNTAVTGSLTASTTLTATLGNITATNGNIVMGTAGNKIIVPTGSNASAGLSGVMSGTPGAVTVATTACSATAKVFYCRATTGGTPGEVSITAQDGTGFTLTSTGNETSTFNWWIINA